MLIGYGRVSTHEQNLDLQLDALAAAGCKPGYVFTDKISTRKASTEREGLDKAMSIMREGDTLIVWRLDRFGRTLRELIDLVNGLGERGVGFKSLTENIDTETVGGKLVFHLFGALAEFERDLIKERTNAGLAAARARGRKGGRPRSITDPKKLDRLYALYDGKEVEIAEILTMFDISKATLYKYLGKRGSQNEGLRNGIA